MKAAYFDLWFGTLKVGVVTQTDSDFPNLWGEIAYDSSVNEPQSEEAARLARFLTLNRESIRLAELEDERVSQQEAVNAELEANYLDFIESEEWCLVDQQGQKRRIHCPILRDSDEIVWRWDPLGAERGDGGG